VGWGHALGAAAAWDSTFQLSIANTVWPGITYSTRYCQDVIVSVTHPCNLLLVLLVECNESLFEGWE